MKGTKEKVNCLYWSGLLVTIKDLKPGEQLLVDYGWSGKPDWQPYEEQLVPYWGTSDSLRPGGQPSMEQARSFVEFYVEHEIKARLDGRGAAQMPRWKREEHYALLSQLWHRPAATVHAY